MHDPPPGDGRPLGRAAFLATIAAGIAGIALAPRLTGAVSKAAGVLPDAIASLAPAGGWRIYSVSSPMPRFDPGTFRLRVSGLVERPLDLPWWQVAGMPGTRQVSDFHCVTGWSVGDVHWEGIEPRTIVREAGPLPSARYVSFLSLEEPYVDQIELGQFLLPDTLIARGMDGAPLTREHGAPLRVVIPQMYGYKGVKWLREIRFDAGPEPGYWEQRGYDVNAWVGRSNGY